MRDEFSKQDQREGEGNGMLPDSPWDPADLKVWAGAADPLSWDGAHDDRTDAERTGGGVTGVMARLAARIGDAVRGEARRPRARQLEPVPDPWDELRRELARSRRYERHFCLVRVPCGAGRSGTRPDEGSCRRARVEISAFLRSVDRAWLADESVYVLLPETDRAMGEAFLVRVRRLAPDALPAEGVRLAAFPDDGATSGALLAAVRGRPLIGVPTEVGGTNRAAEPRIGEARQPRASDANLSL